MNIRIPIFALLINLLFLGLSPLWGAHVHHLHGHENEHNFSIEYCSQFIANELTRYCCSKLCSIESPFEHLFEKGIILKSVKSLNLKSKLKSVPFYICNNNKIGSADICSKFFIVDFVDTIKSTQVSLKTSRAPPAFS